MSFASGATAGTEWESRTEHGHIELFLTNQKPEKVVLSIVSTEPEEPALEVKMSFDESRITAYEIHGWLCLAAWFPLGFALIAT